jgi:hypothetical protein
MVNTVKAEVEQMKKVFSPSKLQQMDKLEEQTRNLNYEIEVIKIEMENCTRND